MKLIKFIGKGVRGYMNHEINFKESVTFLVGINGSGKTSVLKLINGLTVPSYKILEDIEYSYIELSFNNDGKDYIINSTKDKDSIIISFNHVSRNTITDEFKRIKSDVRGLLDDEDFEKYSANFAHLDACIAIRELATPLFIGIDRLPEEDMWSIIQRRRKVFYDDSKTNSSVDDSLATIQNIVYDLYRKNAAKQKKYSEDFKTAVLKEAVGLLTSKERYEVLANYDVEFKKFKTRRCQFVQALHNAGIEDAENMTDEFFDVQKEYMDILANKIDVDEKHKTRAFIGWYTSQKQMDKIDKIISHEQAYESNLKKLNEEFDRFIDCGNLFFKESGKSLLVCDNGLIQVVTYFTTVNGRTRPHRDDITSLSSGEKQILALIGLLIFTPSNVRPEVLIIDEPELSLHLTWQEIFVDAILMAQPNFQFILATHSPSIISKIERRGWCEDLSRKLV